MSQTGLCLCFVAVLFPLGKAYAQNGGDSQLRPPVTKADIEIVKLAREILDSPAKWNRADTRICPADAKVFSLYCALEKATDEVSGNFAHRGAAMQEARFAIDEITHNRDYDHRLMGYNNDPTTTFADIQKVFDLLEARIAKRLANPADNLPLPASAPPSGARASAPARTVSKNDFAILAEARRQLDSPAKWDRHDTQKCVAEAQTVSLFCAFESAETKVMGAFDNSAPAIDEARAYISDATPNRAQYSARLTDFNNDSSVTFADLQKLFQTVEERLRKRQAAGK